MDELIKTEKWYGSFMDEGRSIIVETIFASRWILVEGYWKLGELIRHEANFKKWVQKDKGETLSIVAKDLNISPRTLYYAIKLYDKYPDLDKLPEGKNISWNKLTKEYLTDQGVNVPHFQQPTMAQRLEMGREGEQKALGMLKEMGYIMQSPDWIGFKGDEWVCFEAKYKQRFTAGGGCNFDGHGLDLSQVYLRTRLLAKTGIRTIMVIYEQPEGKTLWQYLDILEAGDKFITKSGKIVVYPINNFNEWKKQNFN